MRRIIAIILFISCASLLSDAQIPFIIRKVTEKLKRKYGIENEIFVIVSIARQKLYLLKGKKIIEIYDVSTSKYGIGNKKGSFKTPTGTHRVYKKIGENAKIGTIFRFRRPTNEIAEICTLKRCSEEDIITTRIIWLEGLEEGINKGGDVDTKERCIYIHGTPEEGLIGIPSSHGCIRMRNKDIIKLFNLIKEGTIVEISKD